MALTTSSPFPVEYNESHALIVDLQGLLCDAELSLHSAYCADGIQIALHTQLLRARSPFFNILLRPPWSKPNIPVSLPFPSALINDLLEYLITGHVRLEFASETLALGRAAHMFACDSLVAICVTHLRELLTPELLPDVLALASTAGNPDVPLPEPFAAALRQYVAHTPGVALEVCLAADGLEGLHARRTALLLIAESFDRGELGASAVAEAALGVAAWTQADALTSALDACSASERAAVSELLCAVPPRLFARCVEHSGAVSHGRVLAKFRADALAAYDAAGGVQSIGLDMSRFVRCESTHPHPRGVTVEQTLRKVRLRGCKTVIIRFDQRSCVGKDAVLKMYDCDPRDKEDTEKHVLEDVSGKLPNSVTLSRNEFWFGLNCPIGDKGTEMEGYTLETEWGWLFHVYPTQPGILDQPDQENSTSVCIL